jgi:hypothetical protein
MLSSTHRPPHVGRKRVERLMRDARSLASFSGGGA